MDGRCLLEVRPNDQIDEAKTVGIRQRITNLSLSHPPTFQLKGPSIRLTSESMPSTVTGTDRLTSFNFHDFMIAIRLFWAVEDTGNCKMHLSQTVAHQQLRCRLAASKPPMCPAQSSSNPPLQQDTLHVGHVKPHFLCITQQNAAHN